jgi:hypothetical protein
MIMRNTWLYLFTPAGDEHVEMRRVRDGRVAPSCTEGWRLTCQSATERQRRVFSVLSACPAVNVGTM